MATIERDDAPSTTPSQQRRAAFCTHASAMAAIKKPRAQPLPFKINSARGAIRHGHHAARKKEEEEEEPQVLFVLSDETEPESEGEVELELVGDDLVEVPPSRRRGRGGVAHLLQPPKNVPQTNVPAIEQDHVLAEQLHVRVVSSSSSTPLDPLESREEPTNNHPSTTTPPPPPPPPPAAPPTRGRGDQHHSRIPTTQPVFPVLPTKCVPGVPRIVAALEEQVMEVALRHAPLIAAAESKPEAWNALARDSRGRYTTGFSAMNRITWLRDVLLLPDHPEHENLSPRLRVLLRQFAAFQPWRIKNGTRRGGGLVDEKDEKDKDQEEEEEENEEEEEEKELPRLRLRKNPWLTVNAPRDELLLRLVLAERPFAETRKTHNAQIWFAIVHAMQSRLVHDDASGLARICFLTSVSKNKTHREQANLTRTLRKLLALVHASGQLPRDEDANDERGDEEKEEEEEVVDEEEDEEAEEEDEEEEEEEDLIGEPTEVAVEPTSYSDTLLLCEILRVRPFHRHGGGVIAKWDCIARALKSFRRQLGGGKPRVVSPTGRSCLVRMRRLLLAVRNPTSRRCVDVTDHQLEMLQLINTLIQTRWPTMEHRETETHHQLTTHIHVLLDKSMDGEDESESESENAKEKENEADEEDEDDKSQLPRRVVGLKRKRSRGQQSRDTQLLRDQVLALQSEVSTVRELLAGEMQLLQSEVAKCRAQLTLQGTNFEHERRDHRRELRGVLEMLRGEREEHTRETERLHAQRTQEFAALMRAITRSSTAS